MHAYMTVVDLSTVQSQTDDGFLQALSAGEKGVLCHTSMECTRMFTGILRGLQKP